MTQTIKISRIPELIQQCVEIDDTIVNIENVKFTYHKYYGTEIRAKIDISLDNNVKTHTVDVSHKKIDVTKEFADTLVSQDQVKALYADIYAEIAKVVRYENNEKSFAKMFSDMAEDI